jgi:predicted transcriptional regulator
VAASSLDLEALHCILWNRAEPDSTVRFVQQEFCVELGTSRYTLNRALQSLVECGCLERLTRSGSAITQKYIVIDPGAVDPTAYA